MQLSEVKDLFDRSIDQIGKVVVGQLELVEGVLIALFAEGSVLIEGPPGLGKTLLVNVLSKTVSSQFSARPVYAGPDAIGPDRSQHLQYEGTEFYF